MTEQEQAAEFNRRRNLPWTDVKYSQDGPRCFTVCLSNQGTDLGTRTDISKRGKVVQVLYTLPAIPERRAELRP